MKIFCECDFSTVSVHHTISCVAFLLKIITMSFLPQTFMDTAMVMLEIKKNNISTTRMMQKFVSTFGITPNMCSIVWTKLQDDEMPATVLPKHLLWTLHFLRCYNSEEVLTNLTKCCRQTLTKWIWPMIERLHDLDIVSNNYL